MSLPNVMWVIEEGVFAGSGTAVARAAVAAGHSMQPWDDQWWLNSSWPEWESRPVVFHGCLENAARVAKEIAWKPGAFCRVEAFACSAWYPNAREWLIHDEWKATTVRELASDAQGVVRSSGMRESVFVRPDSPLKPFSGRVLRVDEISLQALDFGFYYEDLDLPIVVAPVRNVTREWRYVIVEKRVIAGSAYQADSRSPTADDPHGEPWGFAQSIALSMEEPESVYVADICEADGKLKLLELNPFSGADLYACDAAAVVAEVARAAVAKWSAQQ